MASVRAMDEGNLRRQILAIHTDNTLSEAEKAQKRQALLSGAWGNNQGNSIGKDEKVEKGEKNLAEDANKCTMFDESLKCTMCMELCNRPITAPCQHNFCLGCFNKWARQGKTTCPTCRHPFPAKFAANPRINTALAGAIRMAKLGDQRPNSSKAFVRVDDKDRPEEAFVTERAVRAGRANAASGRIMVSVPGDWFGPIPPEHDPRGTGVMVGEFWKDRLDCRQWGAHFPHVAGIAGQSNTGAQSVVLSGGYEDDLDEGEWFLYTGSGGRDLSGNKRVTNVQSFDQTFEKMNKALLVSCTKGLPVRVVRSFKEKRSSYAPTTEQPVRYDGIYRIVRAYRKPGNQGKLVCRYLFVRCDNSPAPWISEEAGDGPWDGKIPKPAMDEMKKAKGSVHAIGDKPWWDYDAEKKQWGWTRAPPVSQKQGGTGTSEGKPLRRKASEHEKALKEFKCKLCHEVLSQPLSTPCGHNFCKPCLEKVFEGIGDIENRTQSAGRPLRERKTVKPCPSCKADIAQFLAAAQVNSGMVDAIAKLQEAIEKTAEAEDVAEKGGDDASVADPVDAEALEADQEPSGEALRPAAAAQQQAAQAGGPPPCTTQAPARQESEAAKFAEGLEALKAAFPQYDEELLRGMLDDQGGDTEEVHACLKRMVRQELAAQRKAKTTKAEANGGGSCAAEKPGRKKGPQAKEASEASVEGDTGASGKGDECEGLSTQSKAGRKRPAAASRDVVSKKTRTTK